VPNGDSSDVPKKPKTNYPKSIIVALAAIREEVGTVEKDGKNSHFGYQYVTEQGMQAAIRPLLAKHKLVIIPSVEPGQDVKVDNDGNFCFVASYTICHTNGDVWPEPILVAAQDKGDKAPWKANTGAFKYLLNRLFMLDTDSDPEGALDSAGRTTKSRSSGSSKPPRRAAPSGGGGGTLSRGHPLLDKQFYRAVFQASKAAHGDDDAMKFHSVNFSVKEMGYKKLDDVPEGEFDDLMGMIKSYPSWYNNRNGGNGDDDAAPF
jgi:hypothetical protein